MNDKLDMRPRPLEEWQRVLRQRAEELVATAHEKYPDTFMADAELDPVRREVGLPTSDQELVDRFVEKDLEIVRKRGLITPSSSSTNSSSMAPR